MGMLGGSCRLLLGRKLSSRAAMANASRSSAAVKWMLPLIRAWASAPPRASGVIDSPVAALMTLGPAMNIWLVPRTMMTKSVMAGL